MLKIEVNDDGRVKIEAAGKPMMIFAEFGAASHSLMDEMVGNGMPVELVSYAMAESIAKAVDIVLGGKGACMVKAMRAPDTMPDVSELVNKIKEGGHA
jgi:hypothetical protein